MTMPELVKRLMEQRNELREKARRFYLPDGSFKILECPQAIVDLRKKAAADAERLSKELEASKATCKNLRSNVSQLVQYKAEASRWDEKLWRLREETVRARNIVAMGSAEWVEARVDVMDDLIAAVDRLLAEQPTEPEPAAERGDDGTLLDVIKDDVYDSDQDHRTVRELCRRELERGGWAK